MYSLLGFTHFKKNAKNFIPIKEVKNLIVFIIIVSLKKIEYHAKKTKKKQKVPDHPKYGGRNKAFCKRFYIPYVFD